NAQHIISDVIDLCGGRNVFAELPVLAGQVDLEAVVHAAPQVIVAAGDPRLWREWRERWQRWSQIPAVANRQLYWIDPDLLHRSTPRLLDGAEQLCAALQTARTAVRQRAP
ncbi:MAG: cobalamin-binding protein, partial [Pseudomonadota bacterium]